MQYKNQIVILGISIFEKLEQTIESVWPTELKKETDILLCCCRLNFKLYSLLLPCSGCVQSKNGVDYVEVSIFYKSEKTSGQTVRPIRIKTVALLYLIIAA